MKLNNFNIGNDNASIKVNSVEFDLQNDFEFQGYTYEYKNKSLDMYWSKIDGQWVDDSLPQNIKISFHNIGFIKFRFKDIESSRFDDLTLSCIGFLPQNMRTEMNEVITNKYAREDFDLLIGFFNNQVIKINCKTVTYEAVSGKIAEQLPSKYFKENY